MCEWCDFDNFEVSAPDFVDVTVGDPYVPVIHFFSGHFQYDSIAGYRLLENLVRDFHVALEIVGDFQMLQTPRPIKDDAPRVIVLDGQVEDAVAGSDSSQLQQPGVFEQINVRKDGKCGHHIEIAVGEGQVKGIAVQNELYFGRQVAFSPFDIGGSKITAPDIELVSAERPDMTDESTCCTAEIQQSKFR